MNTTAEIIYYHEYHSSQHHKKSLDMTQQSLNNQLDAFLRTQQQQAYAMALVSVRQQADALDVVQEAMMAFVKAYKHKPADNWKPLFFRIMQNKITDHHRKQKSWLKHFFSSKNKDELAAEEADNLPTPLAIAETQETGNEVIEVIKQLPKQQQQVIMYRHWQQMSVDETATIMQISSGSVKTHLYRATQKIKQTLGEMYD